MMAEKKVEVKKWLMLFHYSMILKHRFSVMRQIFAATIKFNQMLMDFVTLKIQQYGQSKFLGCFNISFSSQLTVTISN